MPILTPKEKAKQLISKFTFADIYFTDKKSGSLDNAKYSAKLCVSELLDFSINNCCEHQNRKYLEQVKEELEKLYPTIESKLQ